MKKKQLIPAQFIRRIFSNNYLAETHRHDANEHKPPPRQRNHISKENKTNTQEHKNTKATTTHPTAQRPQRPFKRSDNRPQARSLTPTSNADQQPSDNRPQARSLRSRCPPQLLFPTRTTAPSSSCPALQFSCLKAPSRRQPPPGQRSNKDHVQQPSDNRPHRTAVPPSSRPKG